jgi:hypothetical protein
MELYKCRIKGYGLNIKGMTIYLDRDEIVELFDKTRKALGDRQVASVWHEDDILSIAQEMNVTLSPEQLSDVFSRLNNIDANIGVNWESIETVINEVRHDR